MLIGFSIAHVFYAFQKILSKKYFSYATLLLTAGACAIIPDIDSFFGNYASRNVYTGHRGITHSILFVFSISLTITFIMCAFSSISMRLVKKSFVFEGKAKFMSLFLLLFVCGLSHLLADLPQPPGVWGGIPIFFPYKIDGSFVRAGGWSKIGWYDYKILWSFIFIAIASAFIVALLLITEKYGLKILKNIIAVLLIFSNLSINIWLFHHISNSQYMSAAYWERIQNEYLTHSNPLIKMTTLKGRAYFMKLFKSVK